MKTIIIILSLISINASADFASNCRTAKTVLDFTDGNMNDPFAYTSNDYGSHGENTYSLRCERQLSSQKFISLTGYVFYESGIHNNLGCAVYDPQSGKNLIDWFTPRDGRTDETELQICLIRLKERILEETSKTPVCKGMRFPCVNSNTDQWACCTMGNH